MAYSIDIKERAFSLYCQGYSFDRIQQILAEEGIKIARRTIIKWEKQYGWKIRRQKVLEAARQKTDEKHATELAELSSQLTELQNDLLAELRNVPLRSKEGGITALRQIYDLRERLLGDKRFQEHLDEIITLIFEILATDDQLGPVLVNRQPQILEKLEKALKEKYGI